MSVTTTANPLSSAVLQVLVDYDVHHSGDPERPKTPEPPNTRTTSVPAVRGPETWDNEHRRVPPYRALDRGRRGSERPAGSNAIESTFIFLLFRGVALMGNVNRVWRATGGKINDKTFRYAIGGEW